MQTPVTPSTRKRWRLYCLVGFLCFALGPALLAQPIDREALVRRHHVVLEAPLPDTPLSVGNGELAFSVDVTGLQTFPDDYQVPLLTQSQWAWHSFPNPNGYRLEDTFEDYTFRGQTRPYPTIGWPDRMDHPAFQWLNSNPHKFALARVGLWLRKADGTPAALADLRAIRQELQLWTGSILSRFELEGQPVQVQTRVHPTLNALLIDIESPLVAAGQMGVDLRFAYPQSGFTGDASDWTQPDRHQTIVAHEGPHRLSLVRQLDDTRYYVALQTGQAVAVAHPEPHVFRLAPVQPGSRLALSVAFAPQPLPETLPSVEVGRLEVTRYWQDFWTHGGAIDFMGSTDPRARELERRIVLSQYLMAIQAAGSLPPQETGLTSNSWDGKFHLEMHWWHAAHFALWGRTALLERSMGWYQRHLPEAKARAAFYGLAGAQWPKQVGPEGRESPGAINPFLLWQQPHVIYLPELIYRSTGDSATLERYRELVFETADFLASVVQWDEATQRYVIGPPVAPAQEVHRATETFNPTFELAYFHAALTVAQTWRERLGLPRNPRWDDVRAHLSPLPMKDGLYVAVESDPDLWTVAQRPECAEGQSSNQLIGNPCQNTDHPSFVGALGMLPGAMVAPEAMRRTLRMVAQHWNFQATWGWDFPLLAMTAARLAEPALAVDFLLQEVPANQYGKAGHTRQYGFIYPYLPANGALLLATAMMAAGWEGSEGHAPGFPQDSTWQVRAEGLHPLP